MASRRGASYSDDEIDCLLELVRKFLPIGQEEWKLIEHSAQWPQTGRCFSSLRNKFNLLANSRMPTGQAYCPPNVVEAKRILEEIKKQAEIDTFAAVDEAIATEPNEVGNVGAPVPNAVPNAHLPVPSVNVPTSASNESSSTVSSVPAVSPRLQRVGWNEKKCVKEKDVKKGRKEMLRNACSETCLWPFLLKDKIVKEIKRKNEYVIYFFNEYVIYFFNLYTYVLQIYSDELLHSMSTVPSPIRSSSIVLTLEIFFKVYCEDFIFS
jgi:hypothetical protein